MLGGPGQNSCLCIALRETHGLSYGVEVANTLYSDCGVTTIYFGTDKNSVDKCLELINAELNRVCNQRLSAIELNRAKKQLIGQIAIASESNELTMLALAKSLLAYGKIDTPEEIEEQIKAVTAEEIMEAANEVFNPKSLSSLIYK
jgi:predicted Zn-dependent peptidase